MRHNPLKRSALLAVVVGLACLGLAVTGAMAPMAVLPKLDLPLMLGLSAIALALDAYTGRPGLSWPGLLVNTVLGGAVFALLRGAAGGRSPVDAGAGRGGGVWAVRPAVYRRAGAHRHRA